MVLENRFWSTRADLAVLDLRAAEGNGLLPLVPALEEGASKGSGEQVEHQQGGRRLRVNLDPFGGEGQDREDVAVPAVALRRPGADVALQSGVVRELEGARREPRARLVACATGQLGDVGG